MYENRPAQSRLHLSDGCLVKLDIRWHNKPIFVADLCGNHYDIAGYTYDLAGNPTGENTPAIIEVVTRQ